VIGDGVQVGHRAGLVGLKFAKIGFFTATGKVLTAEGAKSAKDTNECGMLSANVVHRDVRNA